MKMSQSKKLLVVAISGFLVGALLILGIRFFTYKPEDRTHYHANFAVFINGERESFNGLQYYEETESLACSVNEDKKHEHLALERAHMHGNVSDVVHVEDEAVTWGNFFQNIGWSLDKSFIKTDKGLYLADDLKKLTFIVNGQEIEDITNMVIGSQDRVLISFGDGQAVRKQFDLISETAEKYNSEQDPESCSGSERSGFTDKLKKLF